MKAQSPYLVVAILLFSSAGVAYFLFNYTTLLGPYGSPGDVYHEAILAGLIFVGSVFVLISNRLYELAS